MVSLEKNLQCRCYLICYLLSLIPYLHDLSTIAYLPSTLFYHDAVTFLIQISTCLYWN